jgi:hypothetical protein
MRVKPETSATRAVKRFMSKGRLVNPEHILASKGIGNFERQRSKMDSSEVFDNEGTEPRLVSRIRETVAPHYSPGVKTPAVPTEPAAKQVKAGWVAKSPVRNIDDAKTLPVPAQQVLGDAGRTIGDKLGLTFKDPGPKIRVGSEKEADQVARVLDKAKDRESQGGIAAITDLARSTFLVNHPHESDKIIAELGKHFEVAAEPWKVTDVNYADRTANVRLPNGVIGEVQMMHPAMAHAKSPDGGGGHDLYKISRVTAENGTRPDPVAHADAVAKQKTLYGDALRQMPEEWKKLIKPR